jgi:hypothetical protein
MLALGGGFCLNSGWKVAHNHAGLRFVSVLPTRPAVFGGDYPNVLIF